MTLADPRIPVAANVTGGMVTTAAEVRDALTRQVTGTVRWVDCMKSLIAAGADTFIEMAPGKVLCGLLKQIDPAQKPGMNVEDAASLEKTLTELMPQHTPPDKAEQASILSHTAKRIDPQIYSS